MENNGKGIFYGVIGVATLIVAIIGATFAFFSANKEDTGTIYGEAAVANLELAVTRVTGFAKNDTENKGIMVPQLDAHIQQAVTGAIQGEESTPTSCVDKNGNLACQVYKITLTNSGTAAATLTGSMTITAATMESLKWTTGTDETTGYNGTKAYAAIGGSAVTDLISPDDAEKVGTVTVNAGGVATYYVVIWISEKGVAQEDVDHGSFTGVVSFNSAGGQGVTSTFTGQA